MGLNTTDDSREGISAYLRRNPATCFVAKGQGTIVGAILSGHDGRKGFIHPAALQGERQRSGIETALVECAMKTLERDDNHNVALAVFAHNEKGNAFREKRGLIKRNDLVDRNGSITELIRIDT